MLIRVKLSFYRLGLSTHFSTRVKRCLFTTVSVQLTFSVLLFSIFMVVFFKDSSMGCMARTRWLAFYAHSLGFEPVEQASRGEVLSSETFLLGLCWWGLTFGVFYYNFQLGMPHFNIYFFPMLTYHKRNHPSFFYTLGPCTPVCIHREEHLKLTPLFYIHTILTPVEQNTSGTNKVKL